MIKDIRITLPIENITEETESVRTFTFHAGIPAEPGQFIMLTDFRGGEKPFSISDYTGSCLSVTVKRIGEFTSRLFTMKKGDIISIRGAYGSSFFIPEGDAPGGGPPAPGDKEPGSPGPEASEAVAFRPVLCGGGFGLPPLFFLAKRLIAAGTVPDAVRVIAAGRTEDDLLFEKRFRQLGAGYLGAAEALDEGAPSGGRRFCGTAAGALAGMSDYNFLYASGPDLMMKSLQPELPGGLNYQFLFERYMKCAIGICGSCAVDPSGLRICKEGPALWRRQVEALEDFGVYRRSASGALEHFTDRLAVNSVSGAPGGAE